MYIYIMFLSLNLSFCFLKNNKYIQMTLFLYRPVARAKKYVDYILFRGIRHLFMYWTCTRL